MSNDKELDRYQRRPQPDNLSQALRASYARILELHEGAIETLANLMVNGTLSQRLSAAQAIMKHTLEMAKMPDTIERKPMEITIKSHPFEGDISPPETIDTPPPNDNNESLALGPFE